MMPAHAETLTILRSCRNNCKFNGKRTMLKAECMAELLVRIMDNHLLSWGLFCGTEHQHWYLLVSVSSMAKLIKVYY